MLDFSSYIEQDLPFQCPECNEELTIDNAIGAGEYPKGGHRNAMKPNRNNALGFECPKCFAKSCFHDDQKGTFKTLYEDTKYIKEYSLIK